MALSIYKTFIAGEVLTAADMNALQNHFVSNALTLISPLTGDLDYNGNDAIMDVDGDLAIGESADDILAVKVGSTELIKFNLATTSAVNGLTVTASATGNAVQLTTHGSDSNIDLIIDPAGTGKVDLNGTPLVFDADADSSLRESADDVLIMKLQNVDVFTFDGDVASPVNGLTLRSAATNTPPEIAATGSDSNIDLRLTPKGTGTPTIGSTDIKFVANTYGVTAADQNVTSATITDLTSLTALTLPNTAATLTARKFLVVFTVTVADTSAAQNGMAVQLYNGTNGTKADTLVYTSNSVAFASTTTTISGMFRLTPGASDRTKVGLALFSAGNCTVKGTSTLLSTIWVQEVV